jgi:hypothetical protein
MGISSSNEQQQTQQPQEQYQQQLPVYDVIDAMPQQQYGAAQHGYGLARIPAATNDTSLSLVAVIVTIYESSSYDPLFRQVPQKSDEGRISVWECRPSRIACTTKVKDWNHTGV